MDDENDKEPREFEPTVNDKVSDSNAAKRKRATNVSSTSDFLRHRRPMELDRRYRVTMFEDEFSDNSDNRVGSGDCRTGVGPIRSDRKNPNHTATRSAGDSMPLPLPMEQIRNRLSCSNERLSNDSIFLAGQLDSSSSRGTKR